MPGVEHADATGEVDVALPLDVPDLGILGAGGEDLRQHADAARCRVLLPALPLGVQAHSVHFDCSLFIQRALAVAKPTGHLRARLVFYYAPFRKSNGDWRRSSIAFPVAASGTQRSARSLRDMKERGIWIVGAEATGGESLFDADLSGPIAWVLGAEGTGMRRLTREACDRIVSIPMLGAVASLNVSVAAGVCLFATQRQRLRAER